MLTIIPTSLQYTRQLALISTLLLPESDCAASHTIIFRSEERFRSMAMDSKQDNLSSPVPASSDYASSKNDDAARLAGMFIFSTHSCASINSHHRNGL